MKKQKSGSKCTACTEKKCEGKYKFRDRCTGDEENIKCKCFCKDTKAELILSTALTIGTGAAFTAGNFF